MRILIDADGCPVVDIAVGAARERGMEYTTDNIDALLLARHTARKIRSGGGRWKGQSKRTFAQDIAFESALKKLLDESERENA